MKYLLDTCVLSEMVNLQANKSVLQFLDTEIEDNFCLSVITFGELIHGAEKLSPGKKQRRLLTWIREDLSLRFEGRILSIDPRVMEAWAKSMAALKAKGLPMSIMDSLIGATCLAHDLTLVTRSTKDFESLSIQIVNPWKVQEKAKS